MHWACYVNHGSTGSYGYALGSGYFEAGQPAQASGLVCRNELLKIQP